MKSHMQVNLKISNDWGEYEIKSKFLYYVQIRSHFLEVTTANILSQPGVCVIYSYLEKIVLET